MQIRSVGIDLGKTTFHLVALSAAGNSATPSAIGDETTLKSGNMTASPTPPESTIGLLLKRAQIRRERHRHNGTGAQEEQDQPQSVVAEMAAGLSKRH
ncbi:MAG TPA: hypothetical protein VK638_19210 [Edaphobacter sp.]|nr:hypothetical protein [Edaphobacter sp.]